MTAIGGDATSSTTELIRKRVPSDDTAHAPHPTLAEEGRDLVRTERRTDANAHEG